MAGRTSRIAHRPLAPTRCSAREDQRGEDHAESGRQRSPAIGGQQTYGSQQGCAADDREHEAEREPAEPVGVSDRAGQTVDGSHEEGHQPGRDAGERRVHASGQCAMREARVSNPGVWGGAPEEARVFTRQA